MTINSVNTAGNFFSITSSATESSKKSNGISSLGSNSTKDTAIISNSAKELAAQMAGKTSQEEAAESVSERLTEQASGKD
ncbi:MAG: hypothetical protein M1480_02245 [Bacteroidetes bacterium]|nr:hypothetical protein [Bacteroidota bacterium]